MANLIFTCESLLVFLTVYLSIYSVSSNIDYNFYQIDTFRKSSETPPVIKLLDQTIHNHKKRDTSNVTVSANVTTSLSATEKPSTPIANFSSPVTQKVVSTPPKSTGSVLASSNFSTVLRNTFAKNLGENGTGIRRNVTSVTTVLPLLHNIKSTDGVNATDEADDDDDKDFSIPKYPSDIDTEEGGRKFNQSLTNHNITNLKTDSNHFYNSSVVDDASVGHIYWVDMTNRPDVKVNELLSQSHRRAATVKLSFEFPFYGHLIENVTIATGGFLYTGDYVHSWLAATQYIAPLMANFDTSLSNDSFIKYVDNGTAFTVEWEKVTLQDKPEDGSFTFQVTLFKNGDIVFVYKHVPLLVNEIQELHHPVKVGLSDAYIMDQTVFLVRRKTIYEYDRVHFNKTYIKNWTTIILKALPTCQDARDCKTCLTRELTVTCRWCPLMNKCSEGYDRHRQNWVALGCDKSSFINESLCSVHSEPHVYQQDEPNLLNHDVNDGPKALAGNSAKQKVGVSGVLAILFLVAMVSGLAFWVIYAYRNPHTTSGQILIRYRPSQWSWRRGEARYTAATIHM
ncbi:plexin domain containing lethal (1) G0289 [Leptinotarsa decemlineata]|uniref:plexin domain containing lethal (1) G0289 n=1 Tax=Leptinotarsa decemlineata TaxID=7539 RepID=UPI003D30A078